MQETKNGEPVLVQIGLKAHKGYMILEPDEVRQVFRYGKRAIGKFTAQDRALLYKLPDKANYKIEVADLVMSKEERDRFEKQCDFSLKAFASNEADGHHTGHIPSFSGRPSVMFRIMEEMRQRAASGKMEQSLKREAEQLHFWAALAIKDHQVPKPASIANALRHRYLQLKARSSGIEHSLL